MANPNRFVVALVAINSPGYRSLAQRYLHEALTHDPRLPEMWVTDLEFSTDVSPWWVAYQVLALDPAPDLVGIPVYCWNARLAYDATRLISRARPDLKIVLGGPEVGPIAEQVIGEREGVWAVVHREGERALPGIVHSLVRGGDPEGVPGVSVRTERGVVRGPEGPAVDPLDALPSPYTDSHPPATDGSAYIETFRGCPHRCAYCYESRGTERIRTFSWDRIRAEIDRVASTPGMRSFSFIDSVFNLTDDRLNRLADIMEPHVARGVRLHTIEVDLERVDAAAAATLRRAGVVSVETGPQTTCEAALSATNRTFDPAAYRRGVEACRAEGIAVEADLIIGLPGDTVESVLESMRFALSADPGIIQMSTLHVLPGTPLWDRAGEYGLTFDAEPPHEIISTSAIGFGELRQLEVFGTALSELYRART